MSKSFEIGCVSCRETVWVGQSTPDQALRLYGGKLSERTARFLLRHSGHHLVFSDDENMSDHVGEEPAEFEDHLDTPTGQQG